MTIIKQRANSTPLHHGPTWR